MATDESSWAADDVISMFATSGPTDPGEVAALAAVRRQARGRVLDIGVGGGRTTGLLADDAHEYIGLDLMHEMVDVARSRFPSADLRVADARDLTAMPPRHFDLVMFSFNGLDAVGHADRAVVLQQMERVLAEDGRLVFSSFSIDGVSFDERPWLVPRLRSGRALRVVAYAVRHPGRWWRGVQYYRETRLQSEDGNDWARRPMRQHEFRFVVHFATLEATVALAQSCGLEVEVAFADDGNVVDPSATRTSADYVHYVCRRPGVG